MFFLSLVHKFDSMINIFFIKQTTKQLTNNSQTTPKPNNSSFTQQNNMVCSQCNCSGHNKTTCQFLITVSPAEQRVAAELGAMLPVVKTKKVSNPLEGLAGCANIFKEPKVVKTKKVSKPLEGLAGSKNIFKEPKVVKAKKHLKTCSGCGEKGHNTRTCANVCLPCPSPTSYCFAGLTAKQVVNMVSVMECSPAY